MRHERGRRGRGMHDGAAVVIEDARGTGSRRRTRSTPRRPCAGNRWCAERKYQQRGRCSRLPPSVATLRICGLAASRRRRRRERRIARANDRVRRDLRERDQRADAQRRRPAASTIASSPGTPRRLTTRRGCEQALLHQVEQVDAARLDHNGSRAPAADATMRRQPCRSRSPLRRRSRVHPFEAVHALGLPARDAAERREHRGRRHRQLAHAHADRVVDGVGDRRRRGDIRRLGDAVGVGRARALVVLEQDHLDGRRLARARDLVVLEVGVEHVAGMPVEDAVLVAARRTAPSGRRRAPGSRSAAGSSAGRSRAPRRRAPRARRRSRRRPRPRRTARRRAAPSPAPHLAELAAEAAVVVAAAGGRADPLGAQCARPPRGSSGCACRRRSRCARRARRAFPARRRAPARPRVDSSPIARQAALRAGGVIEAVVMLPYDGGPAGKSVSPMRIVMSSGCSPSLLGDHLREHRADAGADVLHAREHLDRAVAQDAHLARGVACCTFAPQKDCAMPRPRLTGPGSAPGARRRLQPKRSAPTRRSSRRTGLGSMRSRSASGSMPSFSASSSIACSSAKAPGALPGARIAQPGPGVDEHVGLRDGEVGAVVDRLGEDCRRRRRARRRRCRRYRARSP